MGNKKNRSRSPKKKKDKNTPKDSADLPGWPGYRTREGRSGYDPIDTRTEAAHTAGTIIRNLFTGQVRKPLHLFLLGLLGLLLSAPLVLAVFETIAGRLLPWSAWIYLSIAGIIGLGILVNFIRNLIRKITR
jgi:hypothetical protein